MLLIAILASQSAAQLPDADAPIKLDADDTGVDQIAGTLTFTGIRISQGDLSISAARAESSGLDFDDSTWEFSGSVEVKSSDTAITADAITLRFAARQLANASVIGSPMTFEQQRDGALTVHANRADFVFTDGSIKTVDISGRPAIYDFVGAFDEDSVSGRAQQMQYDAPGGRVTLLNDAWLGQSGNEISGNRITYLFREKRVEAASDEGGQQRVRITINPPAREDVAPDPPDEPRQ